MMGGSFRIIAAPCAPRPQHNDYVQNKLLIIKVKIN